MADAAQWKQACATSPTGYAPFAKPPMVPATFFYRANPAIVRAVVDKKVTDPCGDETSTMAGLGADMAHLGQVHVPVLVVFGEKDSLFPPPDGQLQAARFTGSRSVSLAAIPQTAHAVALEPTRGILQLTVAAWLTVQIESAY